MRARETSLTSRIRASLLLGQFNYGKRGILDLTHSRLFTISSFKKVLVDGGFLMRDVCGLGPPIRDMVGDKQILGRADGSSGVLASLWPRLFAFSFLVVAQKAAECDEIYRRT